MKKKKKVIEPTYVCCSEGRNFCNDIIRKFELLTKTQLMKKLQDGYRFDYVFNASNAVKVDVQISLEEDNNDRTTI